MKRVRAVFAATAAVVGVVLVTSAPASASSIVQPRVPVVITVPVPGPTTAVTIVAKGFSPSSLVYVEQCDGVAPSAPQWSPTVHCDLGSSPSPAIADARGFATFASTDRNRAFHPFSGESPQSLFNCLAPSQRAPTNGLASFTNCTLRVSTSNTTVTSDQAFLAIALSAARAAATPTARVSKTNTDTQPKAPKKASASTKSSAPRSKHNGSAGQDVASVAPSVVLASGQSQPDVGLLSLSDSNVAIGYLLIVAGACIAGLTIGLRRRDRGLATRVTDTQTVGER